MGRRPTPSEEEQRLRQATREAHEAIQGLNDAIREARQLTATLVADYQAAHNREIAQLSNALQIEHNQAARQLNQTVEQARIMIRDQIMAGRAVFDVTTQTVTISWGAGAFSENEPLPYPHLPARENTP